jgi:hypothetical protein
MLVWVVCRRILFEVDGIDSIDLRLHSSQLRAGYCNFRHRCTDYHHRQLIQAGRPNRKSFAVNQQAYLVLFWHELSSHTFSQIMYQQIPDHGS